MSAIHWFGLLMNRRNQSRKAKPRTVRASSGRLMLACAVVMGAVMLRGHSRAAAGKTSPADSAPCRTI
jgi:hypothetical protein